MTIEDIQKLERLEDIDMLEDILSTPDKRLQDDLSRLDGDIMILGVGEKFGSTLSMIAKRAVPNKMVICVAMFSEPDIKRKVENWGV